MTTMYGIKNCDTVAKARRWMDEHGQAYDFHDYKTQGVTAECLKAWCDEVGWEVLLNKAGTTFRKLPEVDRQDLTQARAIALMVAQPSMIKRPVLEGAGPLLVGFKPERYEAALG
ncbi:MAG: ArsC family reductase [Caulobacter sp.]|nr:ArsC family reductase [Caulobacter sp.]